MSSNNEKDASGKMQKLSLEEGSTKSNGGVPTVVMRLILQSADVGKIIGPKGATVEGFKQKTGANISFSEYQPSMPRVAKIAGPLQSVVQAIILISKTVTRGENEDEEDGEENEDEKKLSAVLMVPFPHVGRIIGKRGQRIKQLREESGTTITIVANNVTISGKLEQLENAVTKLTELLQEVSKRNPVSYAFPYESHNSQGSQNLLANQAALQYHMVQLAPDTMQVLIPSSSAGVVIGRGGSTIQRLKSESGASISLSNYVKGAENRVATISGTPRAMSSAILALAVQIATDGGNLPENAKALNIVLLVPPQELGAIIGKKGARITELRNNTSASINVADEGSVTIQGNRTAVSEAITRIAFLLYETRNKISTAPGALGPNGLPIPSPSNASSSVNNQNSNNDDGKGSTINKKDPPNATDKSPPAPSNFFDSKLNMDPQMFPLAEGLSPLLQPALASKFSAASTSKPAIDVSKANVKSANTKSNVTKADKISSNATYAQKTAGIKPASSHDKPIAPIGLTSYPASSFTNASQNSHMSPAMFHTFGDVLQQPVNSASQQGQPQVLFIGSHWSHHAQALSSQQQHQQQHQQSPQRRMNGRGMERKLDANSNKPGMQPLLGGLGNVLQQSQSTQGSLQPQTFSSPFHTLQGLQGTALGQNFYANATSWYTPTGRFQPYTENPQQIPNHQSWQPRQHQQQPPSVVVPNSGIPMNQHVNQQQSMPPEGVRTTNDLWN